MLRNIDRVTSLEASQFRFNNALQSIMLQVGQVASIVKKTDTAHKRMEARLARIEEQQAQLLEKQAQQDEQLKHMSSQLNSIELLLQRLVTKTGA